MGSLSSWYALSSLGIYAVCPGLPIYSIGSPLFEKAVVHLGTNRTFVIQTINNSAGNKYIQSATLNGKAFNRNWISHGEILLGGSLVFEMGAEPNKNWGIQSPPTAVVR
jgi:putative alpha-1,2-mannosidase